MIQKDKIDFKDVLQKKLKAEIWGCGFLNKVISI